MASASCTTYFPTKRLIILFQACTVIKKLLIPRIDQVKSHTSCTHLLKLAFHCPRIWINYNIRASIDASDFSASSQNRLESFWIMSFNHFMLSSIWYWHQCVFQRTSVASITFYFICTYLLYSFPLSFWILACFVFNVSQSIQAERLKIRSSRSHKLIGCYRPTMCTAILSLVSSDNPLQNNF